MRRRKAPAEEPFQMAPMIDMVFLLLVFFMTVSTLAREARPELELAVSATAAVPDEAPPRDVITVISGAAGHVYYWHNRTVDEAQLRKLLQASRDGGADTQLLLRGAPGLPYAAWEPVLRLLRECGFNEVVLATFEA